MTTQSPTPTKKKSKSVGRWVWILAIIAIILALIVTLLVSCSRTPASDASCATDVHYFALDGGKEVPYAFGVKVAQTEQDKILDELHNRRCSDPALTATHMYEWGLISFDEIQPSMVKFEKDAASWRNAIEHMESLEGESKVSITSIAKGLPSLYMVPDGNGRVTVHKGYTSSAGNALTFVNGNTTVMLRLECGFQPVRPPGFPPEVPPCPDNTCPKDPSLDVGVNPKVDDWKKDDGPTHSVNHNDGAEDPQGVQSDPEADAKKAAEDAAAKAKADAAAAEAARKAAEESGGGTVDNNQNHGSAPDPGSDW